MNRIIKVGITLVMVVAALGLSGPAGASTVDRDRTVGPEMVTLTITIDQPDAIHIVSSKAVGIDCGQGNLQCSATFKKSSTVVLTNVTQYDGRALYYGLTFDNGCVPVNPSDDGAANACTIKKLDDDSTVDVEWFRWWE